MLTLENLVTSYGKKKKQMTIKGIYFLKNDGKKSDYYMQDSRTKRDGVLTWSTIEEKGENELNKTKRWRGQET